MADFTVDYSLLEHVESTLSSLKSAFEGINAVPQAAVWGDPGIESAMHAFAGNWSAHRQNLVASMDAMAKQARETRTGTAQWDSKLAQDA